MNDSRLIRGAGAASGIGFAVVLAAAYLMAPAMPVAGTPGPALVHFVSVNSDGLELSWFLASGPALFLGGCFVGVLAVDVWEMGAPRRLIGAGISSAFLAAALLAGAGVSWGLFVYLAPQLNSYALVLVLAESRHFAEGAVSFPAAASAATLSLAARNFGRSWGAISWVGLTAAALQLGNGFDDFAADGVTGALGPLAFSVLMLWIAAFSAALTVRRTVLAPGQMGRASHSAPVAQRDELAPIA
ncbi:MAG TPA: hypothetical protein VFR33_06910 [Candidatus Dormibacteraeota bacterium]|nr:hypothetical protein [Candidatus Dormibacteraeota bacterium]